jgi:hypothetical protein
VLLVQSKASMIACIMPLFDIASWTGQEDVLIDIITLVVGVVVVVDSLSSTDDSYHKRLASGLRSSRGPINITRNRNNTGYFVNKRQSIQHMVVQKMSGFSAWAGPDHSAKVRSKSRLLYSRRPY